MSVIEGLRAPKLFSAYVRPPEARSERCLNCEAQLIGPFCAQCGQRDIPPYPSVRELVTDAFWELSGWDGRFAGTVRTLIRAPGQLTVDFLEGRRSRFISPLRLYLLASLLYFVAAAAVPDVATKNGTTISAAGIQIGATTTTTGTTAAGRVAAAQAKARGRQLTPAGRDSALADIERAPRPLRPLLRRAVLDGDGFRRSVLETLPRALFALVPIYAAILGVFYRRRKYPEHLYFSLHLHAFFFVALTIAATAKLTHSAALAGIVTAIVVCWDAVYFVKAARRVYGGSIAGTLAKSVGIMMLYWVAVVVALLGTVFWAAVH
jgi:hypothetical protein